MSITRQPRGRTKTCAGPLVRIEQVVGARLTRVGPAIPIVRRGSAMLSRSRRWSACAGSWYFGTEPLCEHVCDVTHVAHVSLDAAIERGGQHETIGPASGMRYHLTP